jgi:KipI family sensor histidine kinase inhibitor
MTPTVLPCGDCALVLQIGETVDAEANARIIALAAEMEARALPGVREIVPTYRSLLVRYEPEEVRGAELERQLLAAFEHPARAGAEGRLWTVPCLYGGAVGQDLEELAAMKGLSPDEVAALHSRAEYRIYMIGFAPGFAYLGGLPEQSRRRGRHRRPAGQHQFCRRPFRLALRRLDARAHLRSGARRAVPVPRRRPPALPPDRRGRGRRPFRPRRGRRAAHLA